MKRTSMITLAIFVLLSQIIPYNFASAATNPVLFMDINPGSGSSYPNNLINCNGQLIFMATTDASGTELWRTDGTVSGTRLIKESVIGPGGNITRPVCMNNIAYFSADDGVHGTELWKSDGTASNTQMVKDIIPGSNGTYMDAANFIAYNGLTYFTVSDDVHGSELWVTDGTATGTQMIKDINPTGDSNPQGYVVNNGFMYFTADDGVNGSELWKSDGTLAGTYLLKDINPGPISSGISNLLSYDNSLFFQANDGISGEELWRSDGTLAGTQLVRDIIPGPVGSNPVALTVLGDALYFSASDGVVGSELWKTDGTSLNTVMIKDINPGAPDSYPVRFVMLNKTVLFTATDNINGEELWCTDGTASGTMLVKDIYPGLSGSDIRILENSNNNMYFSANDGVHGSELWRTNGTATGTTFVYDINQAGNNSSSPFGFAQFNGKLLFQADDGVAGKELWTFATPMNYFVNYNAGSNGIISGNQYQVIESGSNATPVQVTPNAGYNFVRWSDSVMSNSRTDTNILNNISVSAVYEAIPVTPTSTTPTSTPIIPPVVNSSGNGSGTKIPIQVKNLFDMGKKDEAEKIMKEWPQYFEKGSVASSSINKIPKQYTFNKDLKYKITDTDVALLQKFLNTNGYVVSKNGLGSIDNESNYFGRQTRNALIKFQKDNGIYPAVGYFGSITREKINSVINK